MLLNPEWAQFWASVIGLCVAIGVPWRLHAMERKERARDRILSMQAESTIRSILATQLIGMFWDAYMRSQNIEQMMLSFSAKKDGDDRLPKEEARAFSGFWRALKFKDMVPKGSLDASLMRLKLDDCAEDMFRVFRTVSNFDLAQEQYALLGETGQLKVSTAPVHIAVQVKRLKIVREACEASIRALGASFVGLKSFENLLADAVASKQEVEDLKRNFG